MLRLQAPPQAWLWLARCGNLLALLAWAVVPRAASGMDRPIIQELLYDGPSTDADDVFTEVCGPPGMQLTGWKLAGINGDNGATYRTIDLSQAVIPADGVLLIATSGAAGDPLANRDFTADVDWQNGPDAVQLLDPSGAVTDALQYGDAGAYNAGEGEPAPLVSAGQSLSRDAVGTDTQDNRTDFAVLTIPTPGQGPAPGAPAPIAPLGVSVPDTFAVRASGFRVPVRITDTRGHGVVAAEVYLSYDRSLLALDSVTVANCLPGPSWSLVHNVVAGTDCSVDTLKVAMATSSDSLAGAGPLYAVAFAVADQRRPSRTPLTLEHLVMNRGTEAVVASSGAVRVIGSDAVLTGPQSRILLPGIAALLVADADEDRDPTMPDRVALRVAEGEQEELLMLSETGLSTGVFAGSVSVVSGAPVPGDGVVQTQAGQTVALAYVDSLDATGQTSERTVTMATGGGSDGRLRSTMVVQPSDTLRACVADPDLQLDPSVIETTTATATNHGTGEEETLTLVERSMNDSVFVGYIATMGEPGSANDGVLGVGRGDTVVVTYADAQDNAGIPTVRVDTTVAIAAFGDVDGNSLVQAFDASRVLTHVVAPFLVGLDSLAANLDSLAPYGRISATDASLILQQRVGLCLRFPVQNLGSANQPQAGPAPAALKWADDSRQMALGWEQGELSVRLAERSGVLAAELVVEGLEGTASLGDGMRGFLVAWHASEGQTRVALAGPVPVGGPGELVRLQPSRVLGPVRLGRVTLNDGAIEAVAGVLGPAVPAVGATPARFALLPNFPNPFNAGTRVAFEVPASGWVEVGVVDLLGRPVRTLVSRKLQAGTHTAFWDGRDYDGRPTASGVYLCRLRAGSATQVRPMVLLR